MVGVLAKQKENHRKDLAHHYYLVLLALTMAQYSKLLSLVCTYWTLVKARTLEENYRQSKKEMYLHRTHHSLGSKFKRILGRINGNMNLGGVKRLGWMLDR